MNLTEAITTCWMALQQRVETESGIPYDHEFTFQFHLAWALARLPELSERLSVRFEVPCGDDEYGETIRLDLLFWTDPAAKVAVELKAPLRSEDGKNSAMTQFRMRFYRDIHRLRHLVATRSLGIRKGVFLAVVNEKGYVMERKQRVNREYRTYHGVRVPAHTVIPATKPPNGYPHEMRMPPHEIVWSWGCRAVLGDVRFLPGMKHYWLQPIVISET